MQNHPVFHETFIVERTYPALPRRVFAAFSDPALKRRWFVEGDELETQSFEMDFQVGGREHFSGRMKGAGTPVSGATIENHTVYQDIIPDQRIVIAYTMSINGQRISASLSTFQFLPSGVTETRLLYTEQAAFFENSDGPALRKKGWTSHLDKLAGELALQPELAHASQKN